MKVIPGLFPLACKKKKKKKKKKNSIFQGFFKTLRKSMLLIGKCVSRKFPENENSKQKVKHKTKFKRC